MSHTRDMTAIDQWISDITNGDSGRKIAKRSGIASATLSRQLAENGLTPETVVRIAHAYGASAIEGLLALNLLAETDVDAASIERALEAATDEQLMDEVLRRMKAGSTEYDKPLSSIETAIKPDAHQMDARIVTFEPRQTDLDIPTGMVADYQDEPIEADQDESRYEP